VFDRFVGEIRRFGEAEPVKRDVMSSASTDAGPEAPRR
jgi:hypothetical protein